MKRKSWWNRYKDIIFTVLITIIVFLTSGITDVIDYYSNSSSYEEYEATIVDFWETSGRYRNYYCEVEYYVEGIKTVEDNVNREYGDLEGDQITIYVGNQGNIYRKGYIKYMNHMRITMIYTVYLLCIIIGFIRRKMVNDKYEGKIIRKK